MSASDVLVLGGPATGKTHYAGQLFGRLRHGREGILRIRPGGEDDLHRFEEVLACLEEGRAAGHTPAATWTRMKCLLESRGGDEVSLEWPDYAGERLAAMVDNRELTVEWQESNSIAKAWLLFIRPSALRLHEDLLTRAPSPIPKNVAADERKLDGADWDDRARHVELLQMLLFASGRSTFKPVLTPRLAVMLSCWDELNGQATPEQVFQDRLPLLYAFIRSTWADEAWSAWGLSSLGRALRNEARDAEFAKNGPENFGYVIPPGETYRERDLTAPIAWLLRV